MKSEVREISSDAGAPVGSSGGKLREAAAGAAVSTGCNHWTLLFVFFM